MLETVAHAHPGVLKTPAPKAYFTSFGDNAIHFELRAWTDQFEQWFQIRTELATAVYVASQAAGMSFPLPQREVRLIRDGPVELAATPPLPQPAPGRSEGRIEEDSAGGTANRVA
jgi:small-conductance mechanosensitive channel